MDQESDLENWARKNGCWHIHPQEYYKSLGYQFYGFGGEAQVYAEGNVFVHKVCRTGQYDNLVRFFDRIVIQNTLCPQAALEVEGFGRDLQNDFVVLMKQRFFTVIAEDLHPGNIWMTGDNNVVIIDGSFKFNTPGLGLGGKFVY